MSYQGDITAGATIYWTFNTNDTDGAPITLAGTPSLAAYKAAGTTQDVDGLTLTVDFDGVTGLHLVTVDTSADGTFYSAGSDFQIVLAAGTVDAVSVVGTSVGNFSIENRNIKANLTQISGDAQSATDLKDFADAGYDPSTNKVQGVVLVDTCTTNTDMRGTDSAYTGTPPTVAAIRSEIDSNSTQLAAIVADTNELQTDWANGGRLDLILDARASQTSVDDVPTVAEFEARTLAAASYATAASLSTVAGYIDTEVASIISSLSTLTTYVDTEVAAIKTVVDGIALGVTVTDKTGFKLASDGLNLIVPSDPSAIPVLGTASIVSWIGFFGAWTVNEVNSDSDSVNLRNSADSADLATYAVSDNGTTFSSAEPS